MTETALALVGLMVLLLGSGVWIGAGLIGTGTGMLVLFRPQMPFLKLLAQQARNMLSSPEPLALPLFIPMAEVLVRSFFSSCSSATCRPGRGGFPGGCVISTFSPVRCLPRSVAPRRDDGDRRADHRGGAAPARL